MVNRSFSTSGTCRVTYKLFHDTRQVVYMEQKLTFMNHVREFPLFVWDLEDEGRSLSYSGFFLAIQIVIVVLLYCLNR